MISLARPAFDQAEEEAALRVLRSGRLVQGPEVEAFESELARRLAAPHVVTVSSGTSALELLLRTLDVGPGDEVLVPDLTWPSPVHAVLACGATPVLVDVEASTWTLSLASAARARTPRTKLVVAIDQFGVPCDAAAIRAALPGLPILEDAACAIGSSLRGTACGLLGDHAILSFHPRKVLTTGEGGAVVTRDAAVAARVRELRNHGQRAAGEFVTHSGNARLNELAAAIGRAQLAKLDGMLLRRRALAERLRAELAPSLRFQAAPEGASVNHQTLGAMLRSGTRADRDRLLVELRERHGVEAGILSYACHRLPALWPAARAADARDEHLPTSRLLADRGLALPLHPALADADVSAIVAAVRAEVGP